MARLFGLRNFLRFKGEWPSIRKHHEGKQFTGWTWIGPGQMMDATKKRERIVTLLSSGLRTRTQRLGATTAGVRRPPIKAPGFRLLRGLFRAGVYQRRRGRTPVGWIGGWKGAEKLTLDATLPVPTLKEAKAVKSRYSQEGMMTIWPGGYKFW